MEEAAVTKVELEERMESMRAELRRLESRHEQVLLPPDRNQNRQRASGDRNDVRALYSRTAGRDVDEPDAPVETGLDRILAHIRIHWEQLTERNRADTDGYLESKEAPSAASRLSAEEQQAEALKAECSDVSCRIQSFQAETESIRALKRGLENSLSDARHWHQVELQNLGSVAARLEAELSDVRSEIEQQRRDFDMLLSNRQRLEQQIGLYHGILDGEENRFLQSNTPGLKLHPLQNLLDQPALRPSEDSGSGDRVVNEPLSTIRTTQSNQTNIYNDQNRWRPKRTWSRSPAPPGAVATASSSMGLPLTNQKPVINCSSRCKLYSLSQNAEVGEPLRPTEKLWSAPEAPPSLGGLQQNAADADAALVARHGRHEHPAVGVGVQHLHRAEVGLAVVAAHGVQPARRRHQRHPAAPRVHGHQEAPLTRHASQHLHAAQKARAVVAAGNVHVASERGGAMAAALVEHGRRRVPAYSTCRGRSHTSEPSRWRRAAAVAEAALTVLNICRPSWPPDTKIRPSNTVTPVALRLTLISVTTLHLRRKHGESHDRKSQRWALRTLEIRTPTKKNSPVGFWRVTLHRVQRGFPIVSATDVNMAVDDHGSHGAEEGGVGLLIGLLIGRFRSWSSWATDLRWLFMLDT
ncbi:hypothetical protein CCH79_00020364 [Gambusia affinis]|uniref:IF rod domain-containing protein n=1 Tax=Gambusia affinis TaxID=33528 RepID=A0A315W9V9_GAMAF|nr:hypothetical protein CCH79_00020364 [Gambusia affinis]